MASTTWRGRIAFGMVSIPVRLYKAARRERIRFHRVYRPEAAPAAPPPKGPRLVAPANPTPVEFDPEETGPVARVRNLLAADPEESGESAAPIAKEKIVRAVEWEKDRYVVFDPAEIAALRPKTSSDLEIEEFVRLAEIDPVFFDTSYYVEPDPGGEKPYAVLYSALSDSGYAAMGSFAMHGREHTAVVRPGRRGLILHTLFYANEVRADGEYSVDVSMAGPKERQLAVTLVEALAAPFEAAKLKDAQEERLRALIERRADSAVPGGGAAPPSVTAAPAIDILEALRKSLAAAKKPAASEKRLGIASTRRSRKK